jgi:hypothetical protein
MRRAVAGSSLSVPVRKDAHGASSSSEAGSPAVTSSEAAVAGMRSSISRFRALRPGRGRDARAGRNVRDASLGDASTAPTRSSRRSPARRHGGAVLGVLPSSRAAAGHAPGRRRRRRRPSPPAVRACRRRLPRGVQAEALEMIGCSETSGHRRSLVVLRPPRRGFGPSTRASAPAPTATAAMSSSRMPRQSTSPAPTRGRRRRRDRERKHHRERFTVGY